MHAPRARADSCMAGPTMTQAACEAASCCWYLGLLRKLRLTLDAASSGEMFSICTSGLPCSSPPSASTMDPKRSATLGQPRRRLFGGSRVQRLDHLVGDVELGIDID